MKYAQLGQTGLIVSKLAFGTMTFGPTGGEGPAGAVYKVDQAGADRMVGQALDAGINHFNTADFYAEGLSEEMLGRALGKRRADVVISTKVGNRMGPALMQAGLSKRHVIAACDDSLRRLGTDFIDIYLAHKADPLTPVEETVEAFETLVRAGKVRHVGVSNWPAWMAATAVGLQKARGYEPFRAAEMYYSLVGRDVEAEVVPFCAHAGVGLIVWSPLAGGFLSGKYTRQDPTGGGGRLNGFDMIPIDKARGYDLVDALKRIAGQLDATPAAVALAWLLERPVVSSVLIGAASPAQLTANLAAADLTLSPDHLAELERLTVPADPYPGWFAKMIHDTVAERALGL